MGGWWDWAADATCVVEIVLFVRALPLARAAQAVQEEPLPG